MPDYHDDTLTLLVGDARERLRDLPDASVQCVVTSPPYFGLRDYGVAGQIGLEGSLDAYVTALVDTFREVRRVLRDDGTVWLNLGDSYAGSSMSGGSGSGTLAGTGHNNRKGGDLRFLGKRGDSGVKPKDLIGVPWRVAFALQADGWYLRADVVWAKKNPMPESVRDRPTRSHEFVFLLTKSPRYYYDAEAVKESTAGSIRGGRNHHPQGPGKKDWVARDGGSGDGLRVVGDLPTRNRRDVWHIATRPFSGAHFAVFPPDLVEPCVLAGTSERGECPECGTPWVRQIERVVPESASKTADAKIMPNAPELKVGSIAARTAGRRLGQQYQDQLNANPPMTVGWASGCAHDADPVAQTVLDPFGGAGTTALVAHKHGRRAVLIELNPDYAALTLKRLGQGWNRPDMIAEYHEAAQPRSGQMWIDDDGLHLDLAA